jgi:hypothetical protein
MHEVIVYRVVELVCGCVRIAKEDDDATISIAIKGNTSG